MGFQITLEAARVNAGYSQKEAAELFGVHYQTLAKWELNNSRMPHDKIEMISGIYNLPKSLIFFGDKNEFIRRKRNN